MRVVRWVLGGLALLLIAIVGLWLWYRQASLPEYEGTLQVRTLDRPVQITRDDAGIPTVVGQTEADALFALGFAHAQDRLWQMDFDRRIAQGRIAELVGSKALDTDRFIRTLGVYRRAQEIAAELDPQTRAMVDAYCAGVNAYLEGHRDLLPPEFLLLRAPRPQPWTPADVVAWTLMMAWDLSAEAMRSEIERMRLAERFSKAEIDEFLPVMDDTAPQTADYVTLYRSLGLPAQALSREAALLARAMPRAGFGDAALGSNSWAVSGARSATGHPLLANDPHLALTSPSVWYFAHLKAPGLDVAGATLPGVPFVVIGRNQHVAWSFTTTYADTQDLFLERIDPQQPERYLTEAGSEPFDVRQETIAVRGAEAVPLTVRSTRHGPVISGVLAAADQALGRGGRQFALALRWASLQPGDTTLRAFRAMNHAADTRQLDAALREVTVVVQNAVFAGDDGHIGMRVVGRVPLRGPGNDLIGVAPAPGWQQRYDWLGWLLPDELPHTIDPEAGVIVTANQKITPPGYHHFISLDWRPPYRAQRIEQLLQERPKHDVASFERIQADVTSLAARDMMRLLGATEPTTDVGRAALQRLRAWDGSMRIDTAEPLLYHAWVRRLQELVFDDDLGPLAPDYEEHHALTAALLGVLGGRAKARDWCADAREPQHHTDCRMLAAQALDEAAGGLAQRPTDLDRLRWGRQHPAVFEHRPLSAAPLVRRWFEQRVPQPGDDDTVDVGVLRLMGEHPFAARAGPSMRIVDDLSAGAWGSWMFAPGQSGNALSPQFGDLLEAWSKVRYRPIVVVSKPALTLTLKPAPR